MSITYKTITRKNPRDLVAPEKYYAAVTPNGSVDFESLAVLISEQCTVTDTDCIAVLNVLEKNIIRELKEGRIVRLGKLGNFQVSLSSMVLKRRMRLLPMPLKNLEFYLDLQKKCEHC